MNIGLVPEMLTGITYMLDTSCSICECTVGYEVSGLFCSLLRRLMDWTKKGRISFISMDARPGN